MVIVFAAPPVTPSQVGALVVEHYWTGWDGSVWSLHDGAEGVILDHRGVVGLHYPVVTKYASTARQVPGRRLRGWRTEARAVKWPLFIWDDDSSADWVGLNDRFFNSIHPELPGTWRVTVGEQSRTLQLTGRFSTDHEYPRDPVKAAWAQYEVLLEASSPYWAGEPVIAGPWGAGDGVPFIDAEDLAPSFHISAATSVSRAEITNPGDVAVYPVWTVTGPLTDVSLTVDGRTIDIPFELENGDVLRIDTDPRDLSVLLNGVDARAALGFQSYGPVPAKGTSSLQIELSGDGDVGIQILPMYMRAF